jgi:hypothetical protein
MHGLQTKNLKQLVVAEKIKESLTTYRNARKGKHYFENVLGL